MPRGKGNKLYDIPTKKAASGEELMTAVTVLPPKANLLIYSGDSKPKTLAWSEMKSYKGERAQRGSVLPRGWPRKVTRLGVEIPT
jgi:topoisomerase-4 subunit A